MWIMYSNIPKLQSLFISTIPIRSSWWVIHFFFVISTKIKLLSVVNISRDVKRFKVRTVINILCHCGGFFSFYRREKKLGPKQTRVICDKYWQIVLNFFCSASKLPSLANILFKYKLLWYTDGRRIYTYFSKL